MHEMCGVHSEVQSPHLHPFAVLSLLEAFSFHTLYHLCSILLFQCWVGDKLVK